jgi:hypothetical protein
MTPPVRVGAYAYVYLGSLAAAALTAPSLQGCSKNLPPPEQVRVPWTSDEHRVAPPPAAAPAAARSHLAATIPRKAIGPFLARSAQGGLLAWITGVERGSGQELDVVLLGQDGAPLGQPHAASQVPLEATALVVRPSGAAKGGWLVAWSALLDRGEAVSVLALAPDGTVQHAPYDVQRTTDHVKWLDVVPASRGAMCVWAEETLAGDANLLAAPVGADGKPRGQPVRVVRGAYGWATTRDADGVDLAVIGDGRGGGGGGAGPPGAASGDATAGGGSVSAGTLSWLRLDDDGHPRGLPIPIATRPTVSGDVDLVPVGPRGWLLGWTDRTGEDARVMLAAVGPNGDVTGPPRRAMESARGAALLSLAAGPAGVALAWAEPRLRERATRSVHIASVSLDELSAQPAASVDLGSAGSPELVATGHGFALLAPARACLEGSDRCDGPLVPSYVRLDAHLQPVQSEPLYVGPEVAPAALAWALQCVGDGCISLTADAAPTTGVYTVDLKDRASPFRAPTVAPLPADAPRLAGVATVASGQPYADVAAVRVGDETLLATLTSAVESGEPRARGAARQAATLALRRFDANGRPQGTPAVMTSRALAVGGVAMAAAPRPDDGVALAWVARDDGDPQVHVARLDRRGRRTNEVQLTTHKGDASDVVIDWAGDGWLVAWVDTRDGNGEVYATKVDRDLQRTAREERITRAPGDAGDLALSVRGDTAFLAWSDPRESPREGLADIYATTLRARDAKRAGDDVRVLSTAAHSRSPALVPAGDGVVVAWIEDAPQGLDAHGTAMVARLDGGARVVGVPQPLPLADPGSASALAAAPDGGGARIVIVRTNKDDVSLDVVYVRADGTPARTAWPLDDLDAPGTFDVALALAGDALYFDDVGTSPADHRVRRAVLTWSH